MWDLLPDQHANENSTRYTYTKPHTPHGIVYTRFTGNHTAPNSRSLRVSWRVEEGGSGKSPWHYPVIGVFEARRFSYERINSWGLEAGGWRLQTYDSRVKSLSFPKS